MPVPHTEVHNNRERTLEELNSFLFYTLYLETAAYVSHLVLSFHDFLVLFFSFEACSFSYIIPVYLGMPYAFNLS